MNKSVAPGGQFPAFDLYIETSNITEDVNGPIYIKIKIDSNFLEMAARRRDFCQKEHLMNTTQYLAPASWDQGNSEVGLWEMRVDTDDFWFRGRQHEDSQVCSQSHSINFDLLQNWLPGCPYPPKEDCGAEMRWVGDSLIYSDYDLDDFVVAILDRCPEFAAKKRQMEMTEMIAVSTAKDGDIVPGVENIKRRRPSV